MTKYNIKLIGLDLDGTVFNKEKIITPHTIQVIEAAIAQGVIVIPATGRPATGIPVAFTQIKGVDYAIAANGASVVDLTKNKVLYSDYLAIEDSLSVLHVLKPFDTLVDIFIDGQAYSKQEQMNQLERYLPSGPLIEYVKSTRKTFNCSTEDFLLSKEKSVEKIHLLFNDLSIRRAVWDLLDALPYITVTTAIPNNLEVNSSTANKGSGIIKLGEILGITKEEIMVCGDSGNDLAMIQAAGLGIAMGNASQEIKEAADFITRTNEEDGVAHAIEKFVLS